MAAQWRHRWEVLVVGSFDELTRRYPKASPSIKQKAQAAQQSTGCN